ncbi:hypothetical protein D9619_002767 [Psilocybe cf. subviscida]|uniref:Uncharacterized protein n=1 Tax=Psilocybe cf. subviscida TaxID=2480587 RepID=A0A8H5ETY6_9AGAR|nr:hypothetical protein D9619_002767 [Psilocybe cf. subviscida]
MIMPCSYHRIVNMSSVRYGHNVNRLKPIFDFAVQSFATTIRPNAQNFDLIQKTRKELSTFLQVVNKGRNVDNIIYTGTHIRRGDRKTLSYSFQDRRVPIADYLKGVATTWSHLHSGALASITPVVYLATDSPDARHQFSQQYQELYQGETFSLYDTTDPTLRALASPAEYDQSTFDAQFDLQSRIRATRGMIVDLALVSGLWLTGNDITPESTVCAMSSSVCRLSAVGLGWERSFGKVDEMGYIDEKTRHWVEVDEKGQVEPVWQAFQLF